MANDRKLDAQDARRERQAQAAKARQEAEQRATSAAVETLSPDVVAALSGDLGFDVLRVGATRKDTWWRVSVTISLAGDDYVGFTDVSHPALLWDGVGRIIARDEWQKSMFPLKRDPQPLGKPARR